MLIAWALEDAAVQSGWQAGSLLGTERELLGQFGVSRETLREAVRIVEARGSMQMQRGRGGGLRLLRPRVEDTAAALAAYLRASDFADAELSEANAAAGHVFPALGDGALAVSLYRQVMEMLSARKAPEASGTSRAESIARRLIQTHGPPPADGIFLGDEARLAEKLGCTRPILREALRMLADLSILQVRRGRGGGLSMVQPSPHAVIRRVFGLIAAQHLTLTDLAPTIWAFNLIRLRLAIQQLRRLDAPARQMHGDRLAALLGQWSEPVRWFNLQRELDHLAGNRIISLFAESFTYYVARLNQSDASWDAAGVRWREIDAAMLATSGAFVQALRNEDYGEAERLQLQIHSHISCTLDCPDLPDTVLAA